MTMTMTTIDRGASTMTCITLRRVAGSLRSLLLAAVLLGFLLVAAPATATIGIEPGTLTQTLSTTQAGGHPDFRLDFQLKRLPGGRTDGDLRNLHVDLPAGFVGSANAAPRCTMMQVADVLDLRPCENDTVVGYVRVMVMDEFGVVNPVTSFVYNIVPYDDEPAAFGIKPGGFPSRIDTSVGPEGGYRIRASSNNIIEAEGVFEVHLVLWGVPADHNGPYVGGPELYTDDKGRNLGDPGGGARLPLLVNPTMCDGQPLTTDISGSSWDTPRSPAAVFATQVQSPAVTGCDKLSFAPTITVRSSSRAVHTPAAYTVDLDVPQDMSPNGFGTPSLKDAKVVLPQGVVLSPGVAHGLGACTDAQFKIRDNGAVTCPDSANIGTVTVTSPLLRAPINGDVYVGEPLPGNRYRIFFAIDEQGVKVKLEGKVTLDPSTGQITATFLDNPPLPFSNFHVEFKGGPDAPLANPGTCGTKTVTSEFSSYAGQAASPTSRFVIDQGCGERGFAPKWTAGSLDPTAGASSPFVLSVSRTDGDQEIDRIVADMPPGLMGYVAKVKRCSVDAAAAGTCGDESQIGTTTVAGGPGSDPFPVDGQVFLTDGYDGAPFGLAFRTHVMAGPYDLGVVNVRAKITVDPQTAALHVDSEPLPRILEGVPLQIKTIRITLDRPGFMRNPTNCRAAAIAGSIVSTAGTVAGVSSPFRVGDCDQLALTPDLALSLVGAKQTTDGTHPAVKAVLTQPDGQAALKKVSVNLPLSLALDPDNAQALCEFVDGQKNEPTCPKGSIVGTATARTPVLSEPLTGPVYFVKNIRKDPKTGRAIKTLPTLAIPLKGEGVSLIIRASSSVVDNHLVTTFDNIPDAPVSRFELNIDGGRHGILVVSNADICKATQIAGQQIDGQNGKAADADVFLSTPSCPLKILSKSFTRTAMKVKVGGVGAGKLTVRGRGLKTTSKTISKSTVVTVAVPLTQAGRRHRPSKLKLAFTPAGAGSPRAVTASLRSGAKTSH
jgi:hypothetical protein